MKTFRSILIFLIIIFFSYTFMNKALMFDSFLLNIAKTGLFNDFLIHVLALTGLIMEFISIILLALNKKWGILVSLGMMSLFTIYIICLYLLGRYEVCGCGGIMNGLNFWSHLLINSFLIILLYYLWNSNRYEGEE